MKTAYILVMDKPEDILRKFKRAVTDSDAGHAYRYDPEQARGAPTSSSIYAAVTGTTLGG